MKLETIKFRAHSLRLLNPPPVCPLLKKSWLS